MLRVQTIIGLRGWDCLKMTEMFYLVPSGWTTTSYMQLNSWWNCQFLLALQLEGCKIHSVGESVDFKPAKPREKWIQLFHVNGDHWIAVSDIDVDQDALDLTLFLFMIVYCNQEWAWTQRKWSVHWPDLCAKQSHSTSLMWCRNPGKPTRHPSKVLQYLNSEIHSVMINQHRSRSTNINLT